MKGTLQKHQGKATWTGAVIAIAAAVTSGFQYLENQNQNGTDDQIKVAFAREIASYREWKSATTEDLQVLEAENKKLMGEVAALTATVKLLAEGKSRDARTLAVAVSESVALPTPKLESSSDEGYEIIELREEKPSPRARAKTVIKKKRVKSEIKASRDIKINSQQVQQQMQDLFPEPQ